MGARKLLVGEDNSLAERMRRRRWSLILEHVPRLVDLQVVDLGGTAVWWSRAPIRPRHVAVVNLHEAGKSSPGVTAIEGDALHADELLRGEDFDLVFSNSLIEHLGGHGPRSRLAEVVASLAPAYLVQTPYRYFPVEPHWMFPGFQFLPVSARSYLAPRWPLGHTYGWGAGCLGRRGHVDRAPVRLGDALLLPGGRDRLGAHSGRPQVHDRHQALHAVDPAVNGAAHRVPR